MNTKVKAVNDLIDSGFISIKESLKILDLSDNLLSNYTPKSIVVPPGLYLLSWVGNSIILSTTTYHRHMLYINGIENWAEISHSGYFEGTSMENVKFIASDNHQSIIDSYKMYNLSDEEIKALVEEMSKYNKQPDEQLDFFVSSPLPHGYVDQDKTQKICKEHKWKQYHGLKESFEFCEICDVKK
jgi:Leucine-rich repeat (LRR) protein